MALDGIVTRAIVHELQACIGARINKIHQPSDHDIIMNLRTRGGNQRLLLSANPTYPRVHFTEASFLNPQEAPMFCMLLRKHCEGGIIEQVSQVGMERIIHIDLKQRDELGDTSQKRIVIELMGRHSNIILLDPAAGTQLDGIHHVTPAISGYRVVMPGFAYTEPPRQNKDNPLDADKAAFMQHLGNAEEPAAPGWIVEAYSGFSPLIAQEVLSRAARARQAAAQAQADFGESLWEAFSTIMEQVRNGSFTPVTGDNAKGKSIFSAVDLTLIQPETKKVFPSISLCMEDYFGDKAERDTVKQKVSDLLRFLQNERSKNIKKLSNLKKDQEEADDADKYRIWGELLLPSLHLLTKGQTEVELVNYYDEEQGMISIPLDPLLTPSENAQRYFKKYNKFKNSLAVIEEQLQKTHEEIAYLDELLQQLSFASMNDIEEIREELTAQGYLRDRGRKNAKKKKKDNRPTLHAYTSSEGIELVVGKNNLQNEYITNRLGTPNDTWLHTKDIPGSHVLIRAHSFSDKTLEEAAQLAAYFSQAKESSSVPVDCTLIRHVRKPSGAKPGFVIYDHQRTLFVTPDEQLVKALPNTIK
ncbi:Rqc2 family fibronectin-binding protein [Paenibacillus pinistramenti]|uniref:Rqc2 family fibronectin-binding protein n=1 Tax=Paenibacillus pinistramenti TaxID=1768003 RepID=UPI001108DA8B|nr:NFACT RNA binding domain-containing protein [Paenibacillus pinistramenti]